MGNWRTVELNGVVKDENEVKELISYLTVDKNSYNSKAYEDGVYYLQFGTGLCGLNRWVDNDGEIDSSGNVYERDCEIEDLNKELTIIAKKFPSLEVILNAGADYENTLCEASFIVKDGKVEEVPPLKETISGIDESKMMNNLFKALR